MTPILALAKDGLEDFGRRDFFEGQIFGGAAGSTFPGEEETAVAFRDAGSWVDVEFGKGFVDPCGWAFEFRVVADRGFVDYEVAPGTWCWEMEGIRYAGEERTFDGRGDLRPLGAEFLVAEDWRVAKLLEDGFEGGTVVNVGLGLDADLVSRLGVELSGSGGIWLAFVGECPDVSVAADAEDLFGFAQSAAGGVVESVQLEGARGVEQEAEGGKTRVQTGKVADGKFELNLGALHAKSIRRSR